MMIHLSAAHYIAGQESRQGSAAFTSVNPRTRAAGDLHFVNATGAEIDSAVTHAAAAFEQTRHFPAARLANFVLLLRSRRSATSSSRRRTRKPPWAPHG
jgi:acyl-CoA reductase-like NAD-dependent aldehyde dehydrogenase